MSRTKNRNQPRHKTPLLTIKNADGTITEVVPAKAWNPGTFGVMAHVSADAQPETIRAMALLAELAIASLEEAAQDEDDEKLDAQQPPADAEREQG